MDVPHLSAQIISTATWYSRPVYNFITKKLYNWLWNICIGTNTSLDYHLFSSDSYPGENFRLTEYFRKALEASVGYAWMSYRYVFVPVFLHLYLLCMAFETQGYHIRIQY